MSAYNCPAATSPATGVTTTTTLPTVPTTSVSPTTLATTTAPPTTVVTTTAPPTTVPTTLPATTLTPYKPCKSWISFSADTSNVLSTADFKTQLAFISSTIGRLNHPERLQYGTVTNTETTWGSPDPISDIQITVNSTSQITALAFSLGTDLSVLYSAYLDAKDRGVVQFPTAAIVFVSDTRIPSTYNGAERFSKPLTDAGVKLTFVLMGDKVDQTLLTNFTTNFVTWRNLNNPEPDDWNDSFVYNCQF
uniref:VWFA domain-containing protein n=1 Tax=Panagrolaimus sp. JU765 TaxID=591449 RepID=A0AC34RSD3_9BILA